MRAARCGLFLTLLSQGKHPREPLPEFPLSHAVLVGGVEVVGAGAALDEPVEKEALHSVFKIKKT